MITSITYHVRLTVENELNHENGYVEAANQKEKIPVGSTDCCRRDNTVPNFQKQGNMGIHHLQNKILYGINRGSTSNIHYFTVLPS